MVQNGRRWIEASDLIPMFPTFALEYPDRVGSSRHAARNDPGGDRRHAGSACPAGPGHGWQSGQALHQNTVQVVIKVHDGTLLMFPSCLEHSIDTNMSD